MDHLQFAGKPQGPGVLFYPNGTKKAEGSFYKGEMIDDCKVFDETGNEVKCVLRQRYLIQFRVLGTAPTFDRRDTQELLLPLVTDVRKLEQYTFSDDKTSDLFILPEKVLIGPNRDELNKQISQRIRELSDNIDKVIAARGVPRAA